MPRLILTSEDLPEIADWTDGETYSVTLEVKQIGGTPDKKSFEVLSAESSDNEEMPMDNNMMKKTNGSSGDGKQEPQEIMANGGTPMRQKVLSKMQDKSKGY